MMDLWLFSESKLRTKFDTIKNNDNKLLTKIFHLNKGNLSNYNNRTYENGLYNRFDEFIKKYSI